MRSIDSVFKTLNLLLEDNVSIEGYSIKNIDRCSYFSNRDGENTNTLKEMYCNFEGFSISFLQDANTIHRDDSLHVNIYVYNKEYITKEKIRVMAE